MLMDNCAHEKVCFWKLSTLLCVHWHDLISHEIASLWAVYLKALKRHKVDDDESEFDVKGSLKLLILIFAVQIKNSLLLKITRAWNSWSNFIEWNKKENSRRFKQKEIFPSFFHLIGFNPIRQDVNLRLILFKIFSIFISWKSGRSLITLRKKMKF